MLSISAHYKGRSSVNQTKYVTGCRGIERSPGVGLDLVSVSCITKQRRLWSNVYDDYLSVSDACRRLVISESMV